MGNQVQKKIIVLDDQLDGRNKYQEIFGKKQYQLVIYQTLQHFIQKQNPKLLDSIVVIYNTPTTTVTIYSQDTEREKDQYQKKSSNFYHVCPSFQKKTRYLKDDVIKYLRRHSLNLTICLYTDNNTTVKLQEHQKPYIKLVSDNFLSIVNYMSQNRQNYASKNIMIDNMFQGLYRRIMVKIIEQRFKQQGKNSNQIQNDIILLKANKISFQYFKDVQSFQHSNVSTTCQYVICKNQHLIDVIDSKRLCQDDYKILLLQKKNVLALKQEKYDKVQANQPNEKQKEGQQEKKFRKNQKLRRQIQTQGTLVDLIHRMKKSTDLFQGLLPLVSKNTIICGDTEIFLKNKEKIKSQLKQYLMKTDKEEMNISIIGKQIKQIISILKKSIYSFVVVFNQGKYLQQVKKIIRVNNFHYRVQLTSIPDLQFTRKPEDVLKFKINYLKTKVSYLIKFQVGPLFSIHAYKPSQPQLQFLGHKLGLVTHSIPNIKHLRQKYMGPDYQKIIQSQHLICDVDGYIQDIRGVLQDNSKQNKNSQFKKFLKIIIMDNVKNLKYLFSRPDLYNEKVVLADYDLQKIEQFLKHSKSSTVSTPFFRKGMLSEFQQQYKLIYMIKNSINLSFKTIVVSENEILQNIFGNQIRFHTMYNIQLIKYSSSSKNLNQQISQFQKSYLTKYIRLWYINYYIFDRNATGYSFFDTIKYQICYCFYKCRSYDLLNINQQDFQEFYINQINSCMNLFDLQVACIYVLSMPHGFSDVITHIFKNPTRSKLAIKIFIAYMIILATAFYDYQIKQVACIQLMVKIKEQNIQSTLSEIKPRDTIFTNDFVFCSLKDKMQKVQHYHTFVFNFENTHFQEKSRINSYLNIQNFSFYKEGAQYIIAPFVKFQVVSVEKNSKGKYQIRLNHVSNGQNSFLGKLLAQNHIHEQQIMQNLNKDTNMKTSTVDKKKNRKNDDQIFLYRRAQINSMAVTKRDTIKQFKKGIHYEKFFTAKNKQKFLTAKMHLQAKIRQLRKQMQQSQGSNNYVRHQLQMLGVDEAFINFKIGQYGQSLKQLKSVQQYLQNQNNSNVFKQLIQLVRKYTKSVKVTLQNRRKLIFNHPKRKFWKLTLKQGKFQQDTKIQFKLKSRSQNWQVNYQVIQEIFPMEYISTEQSSKKNVQKVIKASPIYISFPLHQFGALSYANFHAQVFSHPKAGTLIKQLFPGVSGKQLFPQKNILNKQPQLDKLNSQFSIVETKNKKRTLQGQKGEQIDKYQLMQRQQAKSSFSLVKIILKQGQMYRQPQYNKFSTANMISDFPQQTWSVFYLNNQLKVVPKKNHFRANHKKQKIKNKEIIYQVNGISKLKKLDQINIAQ